MASKILLIITNDILVYLKKSMLKKIHDEKKTNILYEDRFCQGSKFKFVMLRKELRYFSVGYPKLLKQ
jgi:hypothetical protein